MSAEGSDQTQERFQAALPGGAVAAEPAYDTAFDTLLRELNVNDPGGCARVVAAPITMTPLALRSSSGNTIALTEGVVDLGREGLLAHDIINATHVSATQATLVPSAAGWRLVAQGRGPTAVRSARGTTRLQKGDVADVSVGDTIVLRPYAPKGVDKEEFELIVAMEVEAPAAAPESSQPPAAVDQVQAAALTSDAPMAAPRPAATGPEMMSDLNLESAPSSPVDEHSGEATQRGPAHVEPRALQSATDDLARRMSSDNVSVSQRQEQPKRKDLEERVPRNRHKAQSGDKSGEMPTRHMKDTPSKKKGDPDDI